MYPWATLIPPVAPEEGRRGAGDRGRDPWAPGSSGRGRQPVALGLPIPSAAGRQALCGASLRRALQVRRCGLGARYSQR